MKDWSLTFNMAIYIPEKIKVGFQKREGTYTKKLAYVIYYDNKGKLRKEYSWNSWRDKKIQPEEYTNEPTSGFVLNKNAGGYSSGWNHRQAYARVFDPRGFEFEITVPNLLYILENTDCLKGKGLAGDFVYGWDGTDLVLIPSSAPEFEQLTDYSKLMVESSIKAKDLIVGAKYLSNKNEEWIYMGKFEAFGDGWNNTGKALGKRFFFYSKEKYGSGFFHKSSISGTLIKCVYDSPVDNYAELMDSLEAEEIFSPYDPSKDKLVPLTEKILNNHKKDKYLDLVVSYGGYRWLEQVWGPYLKNNNIPHLSFDRIDPPDGYHYYYDPVRKELENITTKVKNKEDLLGLAEKMNITVRKRFLRNGKEIK